MRNRRLIDVTSAARLTQLVASTSNPGPNWQRRILPDGTQRHNLIDYHRPFSLPPAPTRFHPLPAASAPFHPLPSASIRFHPFPSDDSRFEIQWKIRWELHLLVNWPNLPDWLTLTERRRQRHLRAAFKSSNSTPSYIWKNLKKWLETLQQLCYHGTKFQIEISIIYRVIEAGRNPAPVGSGLTAHSRHFNRLIEALKMLLKIWKNDASIFGYCTSTLPNFKWMRS